MNLFKHESEKESVIVQVAQRSPQLWAIGLGTLLFNGIVLTLGNAYISKMLDAEEKIRELEAKIEELAEGDTVEGIAYRLSEVETKTAELDG